MRRLPQLILLLIVPLILTNCALFGKTDKPVEPAQPQATAGGTPKVVLAETTYDFGKITEDKDYIHEFAVKNGGTGVLLIEKISLD